MCLISLIVCDCMVYPDPKFLIHFNSISIICSYRYRAIDQSKFQNTDQRSSLDWFFMRWHDKKSGFQAILLTGNNKIVNMYTVFPRIVSAETILFWKLKCGNYSREETIQGRKLFFFYFSVRIHNLNSCRILHTMYVLCLPNKVMMKY